MAEKIPSRGSFFGALLVNLAQNEKGLPDDAADEMLSSRLRELRQNRQLTIRALADLSGLSVNTLSMIENGKTSPSVSTLQQLARALGVPISAFFTQPIQERRVVHTRRNERPGVNMEGNLLEHLGLQLVRGAVQPVVVTLQPNADSGLHAIVHTGYEFVYCLEGRVLYTIQGQAYLLETGDSLVFESHLSHRWQNLDETAAQILLVMVPTDERDEPVEKHFSTNSQFGSFGGKMKIAVITDDGQSISRHFGRAAYYQVVTIENGQILSRELRPKLGHQHFSTEEHGHEHHAGQEHGFDPAAQQRHNRMAANITDCSAVICGGMGRGAYESLKAMGLQPLVTEVEQIDDAALAFNAGQLVDRSDMLH